MSAWYGIRPLCGDPNAKDQSSASRDHVAAWPLGKVMCGRGVAPPEQRHHLRVGWQVDHLA